MRSSRSAIIVLILAIVVIAAVLLLFGHGTPPFPGSQTKTPTPTSTPTQTVTPSPTITPTQTVTPTPTITPTSTITPTPVLAPVALNKGPDVIYTGRSDEMKLFWQWTSAQTFRVDWGTDLSYSSGSAQVEPEDPKNYLYAYTITGLNPGTKYLYRVVTGLQTSSGSFFTAPDASAEKLKFVAYGDTRSFPEIHEAVAGQVVRLFQSDPDYQTFDLNAGDLVSNGEKEDRWKDEFFDPKYKNIRAELANLAVLPVMGNHEGNGVLFSRYFPMPFVAAHYWSFDYGPVHVVMLDQYTDYRPGSAQYTWMVNDLAGSQKTWKFVSLHEPGWSADGGHSNNEEVQHLQPLFEQYGVSIVFGGHNHYYARAVVNGIQHLTIGTGGAPFYSPDVDQPNVVAAVEGAGYTRFEIDDNQLTGSFIDGDGKVRDTFTIKK